MTAAARWAAMVGTAAVWRVGPVAAREMRPDPTALATFRRRWPHRTLRWNAARQLWEVWQRHPVTGLEDRVAFVFWWDANDPDRIAPPTEEELSAMVRTNDPRLTKVYRPFDARIVQQWMEDSWRYDRFSPSENQRQRQERNRARDARHVRDSANQLAAAWGELRRWFPALASKDASDRLPFVPVGASLN